MIDLLMVGVGGFLGSIARFLLGGVVGRTAAEPIFPIGTLTVNLLGCLAIGVIAGLIEKHHVLSPTTRLLVITGFLGGFTTFSAFGFETVYLFKRSEIILGLINVFVSLVGGLGCVWIGLTLVERLGPKILSAP